MYDSRNNLQGTPNHGVESLHFIDPYLVLYRKNTLIARKNSYYSFLFKLMVENPILVFSFTDRN